MSDLVVINNVLAALCTAKCTAGGMVWCAGSSNTAFVSGMISGRMALKGLEADLQLLAIDPPPRLKVCLGYTWLD